MREILLWPAWQGCDAIRPSPQEPTWRALLAKHARAIVSTHDRHRRLLLNCYVCGRSISWPANRSRQFSVDPRPTRLLRHSCRSYSQICGARSRSDPLKSARPPRACCIFCSVAGMALRQHLVSRIQSRTSSRVRYLITSNDGRAWSPSRPSHQPAVSMFSQFFRQGGLVWRDPLV